MKLRKSIRLIPVLLVLMLLITGCAGQKMLQHNGDTGNSGMQKVPGTAEALRIPGTQKKPGIQRTQGMSETQGTQGIRMPEIQTDHRRMRQML